MARLGARRLGGSNTAAWEDVHHARFPGATLRDARIPENLAKRMSMPGIALRILVPALLMLTGCSGTFEREWKTAASRSKPDAFSGRWEGAWRSAKHRNAGGRLRCVMTPIAANRYEARFKADWMMFSSTYATIFDAQRKGRELHFRGSENLGRLFGGVYTFEGRATPEHFSASYDSSYDRGTFEMGRPAR